MANGTVEQPKLDDMEIEKFGPSSSALQVTSYTDSFGEYHGTYIFLFFFPFELIYVVDFHMIDNFFRAVPKLIQAWPMVKSALKEHGISCKLNLV